MAEEESQLAVRISQRALADLWDIWCYNAELYGIEHADNYSTFLNKSIQELGENQRQSREVRGFSPCRYVTAKLSRRGHGHYVIFSIDKTELQVNVLRICHTRMDVAARLKGEV